MNQDLVIYRPINKDLVEDTRTLNFLVYQMGFFIPEECNTTIPVYFNTIGRLAEEYGLNPNLVARVHTALKSATERSLIEWQAHVRRCFGLGITQREDTSVVSWNLVEIRGNRQSNAIILTEVDIKPVLDLLKRNCTMSRRFFSEEKLFSYQVLPLSGDCGIQESQGRGLTLTDLQSAYLPILTSREVTDCETAALDSLSRHLDQANNVETILLQTIYGNKSRFDCLYSWSASELFRFYMDFSTLSFREDAWTTCAEARAQLAKLTLMARLVGLRSADIGALIDITQLASDLVDAEKARQSAIKTQTERRSRQRGDNSPGMLQARFFHGEVIRQLTVYRTEYVNYLTEQLDLMRKGQL